MLEMYSQYLLLMIASIGFLKMIFNTIDPELPKHWAMKRIFFPYLNFFLSFLFLTIGWIVPPKGMNPYAFAFTFGFVSIGVYSSYRKILGGDRIAEFLTRKLFK